MDPDLWALFGFRNLGRIGNVFRFSFDFWYDGVVNGRQAEELLLGKQVVVYADSNYVVEIPLSVADESVEDMSFRVF